MPNLINGNTYYVDTASGSGGDPLSEIGVSVTKIVITGNGSEGLLTLSDNSSPVGIKLSLRLPAAVGSQLFDFEDAPLLFPNGIDPTTVTNLVATVVFKRQGRGRS